MAFFKRLPKREIELRYTHVGWFYGLCPIYIGDLHHCSPSIDTRNWIPDWWFDVVLWLFECFCFVAGMIYPDFAPMFPLAITGKIGKGDSRGPL